MEFKNQVETERGGHRCVKLNQQMYRGVHHIRQMSVGQCGPHDEMVSKDILGPQ